MLAGAGTNTRLCHLGHDPFAYHGFVNPPVVHASTVLFPDVETMESRRQKYTYGTRGTPTTDALCAAIDALKALQARSSCHRASRPSRCLSWRSYLQAIMR